MNFTAFFIKRPVFATIFNLMILIVGALSYTHLTLREYPDISNPIMSVEINYPNASPEVVEQDITNTLEEVLASLEGIETITSKSFYGRSQVEIRFKPGIDMTEAQSNIRDRLGMIRDVLPERAKDPVVRPQDQSGEAFFYMSLTGERYSFAELTHMAKLFLKDPLKIIKGVSQVVVYGDEYSMMISLDRNKLLHYELDPKMIYEKLRENNVSLPAGRYKEAVPINFDLELKDEDGFRNLPITTRQGKIIHLKDVATITLSTARSFISRVNGKQGVLLGVVKSSDGNPLEIANTIYQRFDEYKKMLPEDVTLTVNFDKTKFIRGSLASIQKSILEAMVLVIAIVYLFLRSVRSTLIPIITIPISLIGVMSLMSFFGLSINTITLLAMVLAVGLVVDDAIVVLENIHRHIEEGLTPMAAALKGAKEIGFAIVAMTFTLAAVYAPVAFMQDTIGQVFFEFAITLAGAVFLSGIIALTFSPLMCSKLLTPHSSSRLKWFDRALEKLTLLYKVRLSKILQWPKATLLGCFLSFGICAYLYTSLPQSITPQEDRGVVGIWMPYVAGLSLSQFDLYVKQAEKKLSHIKEAPTFLTFAGGWGANVVAGLVDWSDRKRSSEQIVYELRELVKEIHTAEAYPWSWDSGIPGVEQVSSSDTGIALILKTTGSYEHLSKEADKLKTKIEESKKFADVHHDLKLNFPGYNAIVDRNKLALTELKPEDIAKIIAIMMDQNLDLEFKKDGIRYSIALVNRVSPTHLEELYTVKENKESKGGEMITIPLSSFLKLERSVKPKELTHFNKMRAARINANLAKGVSMGKGIADLEKIATETLPRDVHFEFTGAAEKLKESSGTMLGLIFVAMLFIYCILAIQFESFIDPLIIMFTVPLAGLGALLCVFITGGSMNIFTQVGLVTLIGLITKHGILIVEFANQKLKEGVSLQEAIIHAANVRLRPILMTTGAMVFGSIPLIFSSGAGAEARQAIGYVLIGGLSLGTMLTLFVIPVVYEIIKGWKKINPSPLSIRIEN